MPAAKANGMPVKQEVEKVTYEPIKPIQVMPAITPVPIIFEKKGEESTNGKDITGEEYNGVGADNSGFGSDDEGYNPEYTGTNETEDRCDEPENESAESVEYLVYGESIEEPEPESQPEEYVESEPEPEPELNLEYLGEWTITAYCGCAACCGSWGNATASERMPVAGHTVACNSLPFFTKVMIDGVIYEVEDTGSTIYGDEWIDIYFDTHDEALAYGLHTTSVYIVH